MKDLSHGVFTQLPMPEDQKADHAALLALTINTRLLPRGVFGASDPLALGSRVVTGAAAEPIVRGDNGTVAIPPMGDALRDLARGDRLEPPDMRTVDADGP